MCSRGIRCSGVAGKRLKQAMKAYEATGGQKELEALRRAKKAFLLTPAGIKAVADTKPALATVLQAERAKQIAEARRLAAFHLTPEAICEEWRGDIRFQPDLSNPLLSKAYSIACSAHAGVRRKTGEPYINHPLRVALRLSANGHSEEAVAVALLHDAVEDSALELQDLRAMGFSEAVVDGVDSVTKREGEPYTEAVIRATKNRIGRWVKLADNLDNSCEEQLAPFNEQKRLKQKRKYAPARALLVQVIRAVGQ